MGARASAEKFPKGANVKIDRKIEKKTEKIVLLSLFHGGGATEKNTEK